ncbi:MAG: hypothetical protein NVV74_01790 [Magnetospirillum sp.]|nr:hypothetical protein [Magnetospirillum sp.]
MTARRSYCPYSEVETAARGVHDGNVGEFRKQLTDMLRCAGKMGCELAVSCSDRAFALLRRTMVNNHS